MNKQVAEQILSLLGTLQEACQPLYDCAHAAKEERFKALYTDMSQALRNIIQASKAESDADTGAQKLNAGCQSCLDSLESICLYNQFQKVTALHKIEFELLPLLQETYLQFYYFGFLQLHPEKLDEYNCKTIRLLCGNPYIDEAIQRGFYKYDLSILVVAYNKLEYTKQCVESLLTNLPRNLTYELIFINHGSNDGTKAYFAGKKPDKQLDISVNGGGLHSVCRIVEGEFTLTISNDVLIGKNAIENLVTCIRSDPRIAWVVPSTSNISNLQPIPADYTSKEEFIKFTEQNNQSNPFRWEQRTRLCNPIEIIRNSIFYSSKGLCVNGRFHSSNLFSFPDDEISIVLRRNGYKMMLAKDSYCHHFGSVTLKNEVQKQGEAEFYLNGRKAFYEAYGVDPWGTGFCYAMPFLKRVVGDEQGHVDVLGISCGLGANSLKIKEQIKEYCHNLDVALYNITDARQFEQDIKGVSDKAAVVSSLSEARKFFSDQQYQYIVWEDPFLLHDDLAQLFQLVRESLTTKGTIFVKKNLQTEALIKTFGTWADIGDDWMKYQAE